MAVRKFTLYKLHFTSPLHIGDSRDDYGISHRTISSDTMYAALTATLAKMGKEIPTDGDLGCAISNLYPFYQKDSTSSPVLFFPKPLTPSFPHLKDVADAKKVKKVQWLDQSYFEQIISGATLFDQCQDIANIHNEYLTSQPIAMDFVKSIVSQRVLVSRDYQDDACPFYMDRVLFLEYSGLFFLCEGDSHYVDLVLPLLSCEGIGTDRNVGNGFFEYEKAVLELSVPDEASHMLSLSMFLPNSKQQLEALMGGDFCAYGISRRGGWITTYPNITLRKNAVYAFVAGSVFPKQAIQCSPQGRIVDLRPPLPMVAHPIWRCGRSIFVPMK